MFQKLPFKSKLLQALKGKSNNCRELQGPVNQQHMPLSSFSLMVQNTAVFEEFQLLDIYKNASNACSFILLLVGWRSGDWPLPDIGKALSFILSTAQGRRNKIQVSQDQVIAGSIRLL